MKILLLEDEYSLRISIEEFLTDLGYDVDGFMDGEDAYNAIYDKKYDLLLLDVKVPTLNGFELLNKIRADGKGEPAIFLTSMTNIDDLKKGYKNGCSDYIRKPFDLEELELRIDQALVQISEDDSSRIEIRCDIVYDAKKAKLTIKNREIVLRKIEQEMLEVLLKHKNIVVSMQMFQDEIWGEYVEPATIRVHLNNLRKKLPDTVIKNRRSQGYIIER
ncbi:MAG: response regulator transcription factor [Sulfurimonas sp.]